jgi:hypothetical protein
MLDRSEAIDLLNRGLEVTIGLGTTGYRSITVDPAWEQDRRESMVQNASMVYLTYDSPVFDEYRRKDVFEKFHSIEVTESMRHSALEGFPMFAKRRRGEQRQFGMDDKPMSPADVERIAKAEAEKEAKKETPSRRPKESKWKQVKLKGVPIDKPMTAAEQKRLAETGEARPGVIDAQLDHAQEKAGLKERVTKSTREKAEELIRGIDKDGMVYAWNFMLEGTVDKYRAILVNAKKLNYERPAAYWFARLSNSSNLVIENLLIHGAIRWNKEGVILPKEGAVGEGLVTIQKMLGDEWTEWLGWVIAHRAKILKEQGRERLFTDDDIAALMSVAFEDVTPENIDEVINNATKYGGEKLKRFELANNQWNEIRRSVLDYAQFAGIINAQTREGDAFQPGWDLDFYLPFYRNVDEGEIAGIKPAGELANQPQLKRLLGGTSDLGDPLYNIMSNLHYLVSASQKNLAARAAIKDAMALGIAQRVPSGGKNRVWVLINGKRVHFEITDPMTFRAITANYHPAISGFPITISRALKRAHTAGVTWNPAYIASNLIRDSIHSLAVSRFLPTEWGPGAPLRNIINGWKLSDKDELFYMMLRTTGGAMDFGHLLSGDPDKSRKLLEDRLTSHGITLGDEESYGKLQKAARLGKKYLELSNRVENLQRVAAAAGTAEALLHETIFNPDGSIDPDKVRIAFEEHGLDIAFQSRDLLDFHLTGSWQLIQALVSSVSFFNARLQGLYKMGRSTGSGSQIWDAVKGNPTADQKRFAAIMGTYALAGLALYLMFYDREEYKELEEWEKDSYHHFWLGNQHFRIPKPFEVGTASTLAERTFSVMLDDEVDTRLFAERLKFVILEQLNFSAIPQIINPGLEVAMNKNKFTDRQIESMSMQRMRSQERRHPWTPYSSDVLAKMTGYSLSPIQMDHLVKGYLGWFGARVSMTADFTWRILSDEPEKPSWGITNIPKSLAKTPELGRFYRGTAPKISTKYTTAFYEEMQEANEIYESVRQWRALGRHDRALDIAVQNRDKLAARKALNATQKQLAKINRRIKAVHADRSMTSARKAREIERLTELKNKVTSSTMRARRGF